MNKKLWVILSIAMIVVLALSACQRAASKAPVSTPTAAGDLPFPLPATNNAMKVVQSGTQTAIAAASGLPTLAQTQPSPAVAESSPTLPPLVLPTATSTIALPPTVAPTFATVATATPGIPTTYTLHQGEWPFCIARRYNIDPADLLAANGLSVNSRPAEGTSLKIPQDAGKWTSGDRALIAHPAIHPVVAGDTIYSLACDYGDVDPNAIIAANGLKSPYTLTPGQSLQIP